MRLSTLPLLLACFSLSALPLHGAPQDDSNWLLTEEAKTGDLPIEVELTGTFVADNKDEIRMEPQSYRGDLIITKLVSEGASVKEGEVLMEFDKSNLEDSLEEAEDEVKAKDIDLEKAEAELKSWEIEQERKKARHDLEVENARKDYEKAKEQAGLTLADKNKSLRDAENRVKDAEVDFAQLKALYDERELHTSTENILIEREKRALEDARRSQQKTIKEFELWQKYDQNREVQEKKLDYDDKLADGKKVEIQAAAERKEKEAAVTKARRALEKAQEKVAELEEDSQSLLVKSPRDGVVFYGTLASGGSSDMIIMGLGRGDDEMKVGGRVRTFQVLMTVASMDKLSVRMQALEGDIQYLEEGLPIVVRPDAFPMLAINGELSKVDQVASRSGFLSDVREFTVRGAYEGHYPQLRSGMNCRVTVRANSIKECVHIPILSVFSEGDEHFVWLVDGEKRFKQEIEIGSSNGSRVEVTQGLRPGQVVALHNPNS